ncbi:MAG: hypothetical protein WDZ96_04280 [Acidimicrobiia bacterium]
MRRWCAVIVWALVVAGCSSSIGTSVGVVTEVEGTLSEVESFTVLSEGEETRFVPLEGQSYEFPLDHLREHLLSGEPVIVEWEIRDDVHYALAITDG